MGWVKQAANGKAGISARGARGGGREQARARVDGSRERPVSGALGAVHVQERREAGRRRRKEEGKRKK
jgi:hypothetical protein